MEVNIAEGKGKEKMEENILYINFEEKKEEYYNFKPVGLTYFQNGVRTLRIDPCFCHKYVVLSELSEIRGLILFPWVETDQAKKTKSRLKCNTMHKIN